MTTPKSYAYYNSPNAILEDTTLTTAEKRQLLKDWEEDEHQNLIAEEENMPLENGGDDDDIGQRLSDIQQALAKLG